MPECIRYRASRDVFEVVGRGEFTAARNGVVVLPVELLREASLTDLRKALWGHGDRTVGKRESSSEIFFTEVPWEDFDPDTSPKASPQPILDIFRRDRLAVSAVFYVDDGHEPREDGLREVVGPVLSRHRAVWSGVWTDDDHGPGLVVGVVAAMATRGRTVGELYELGVELVALLGAASGTGELTARSTRDLLRAGRAHVLVGQRESSWLEVKEPPYRLDTDAFEAAKDVAAFANTGADALLVLGLRRGRHRGGDVVHSARPFPLDDMDVDALRKALNARILPTILDLDIDVVEHRAGCGYGYIFIPAQGPELHPFLVAGAIADGKYIGSHLTIPYRAGEHTVFADPARIHSLIAAGRAALGQRNSRQV
jgi:hypothetical protein